MMTGLVVLKIVLMPSSAFLAILANSGPRWSISGIDSALSTRSGTGDGPGIWRKWRPGLRAEFWAIGRLLLDCFLEGLDGPAAGVELKCCTAVKPIPVISALLSEHWSTRHPVGRRVGPWGSGERRGGATSARSGAASQGRGDRRRVVRPLHPRPLRHRC